MFKEKIPNALVSPNLEVLTPPATVGLTPGVQMVLG